MAPHLRQKVKLVFDTAPLLTFMEIFDRCLHQLVIAPVNFSHIPSDFVRTDTELGAAGAHEAIVRFYPSDSLLRFAATVFARDFNIDIVEQSGHSSPFLLIYPDAKAAEHATDERIAAITAGIDVQNKGIFIRTKCHLKK
jgi:hypothetical protein